MLGPAGYGSPNFVALSGAAFPYQIDFENDPTATAPAQVVTITDQLDPNLDCEHLPAHRHRLGRHGPVDPGRQPALSKRPCR